MPKENKQLRQVGEKIRSERLVSTYIRAIGNKKTETFVADSTEEDNPQPKLISKAERLARELWDEAFKNVTSAGDKKLKFDYRQLLINRIEGRPGVGSEEQQKRGPIPSKISERGKERVNQIADSVVDEGDDKFTTY